MKSGVIELVRNVISSALLILILSGKITSPDQIPGEVDVWEWQCLSGAIMCENPYGTTMNCLLTGCVPINRRNSSHWNGNTIEEVILAKDGGYLQYAVSTRDNFRSIECSDRVRAIAKYLLVYGVICPENVVYQGKNEHAGSGLYWKEPTPNEKIKYEYFCYE